MVYYNKIYNLVYISMNIRSKSFGNSIKRLKASNSPRAEILLNNDLVIAM